MVVPRARSATARAIGLRKDRARWNIGPTAPTTKNAPINKESKPTHATKLQPLDLAQLSAGSSSGGSTTPCAVTNAPGDPSWWQFVPDPQRAQPLPSTYQHKQPPGCAPDFEEGELLPQGDDGEYQDPKLPPGVIDISKNCDGATAKSNASTNGPALCLSGVVQLAQAHKRAQNAAASRRREMPPATKPRGIA